MPEATDTASPPPAIRLAMVEDDAACRLAVVRAVAAAEGLAMVWAAASRAEALAQLRSQSPGAVLDVLLVDLGLPDGSGLDVIAAARAAQPACAVMVSTIFGDEENVLRSIEAGAMGYLLKDLSAQALVDEIRSLHAGGSPINPMVARKLLLRGAVGAAPPPAPAADGPLLSAREAEVLRLVARGYTVDEVAGALGVSRHTVRTFVRRIYAKLQVGNRAEAVREGARQGWLHEG
ncbi:response regulator transcription factor [Comamonas humi]